MKRKLLSGLLVCFAITQSVNGALVQSAEKDASGVTMKLDAGLLRLEVCDDRTIHVVCSPTGELPKGLDFVVEHKYGPVSFEWLDESDKYVLKTGKMSVKVDKATGVLDFVDAKGNTLLKESAQDARKITETASVAAGDGKYVIQQTFMSPEDEYLYGMAQGQDGIWNWRGMPIELRQVNTQAALPMMVSSYGYGLLWNNASLTDFNPVDQEIVLTTSNEQSQGGPTATEQLSGQNRGPRAPRGARSGSFTAAEAGEYVFMVKNGDRRNEIGIEVNGDKIIHLQNMWVTYTAAGKKTLDANSTATVKLLGGGRDAKLYARALGNTTTFRSQRAEAIDYYFFCGPELDDVLASYRTATGAAPLWPKWAYGFWQCRERYSSQKQILDTVAEFRNRQIPVDLIVQDWQYWGPHGWGAYQWDNGPYPDPATLLSSLHQQNVKFMISVWSNPQGIAGNALKEKGYKIDGTDWVDPFNPEARKLRWDYLNEAFFKIGTDSWWQDATEPGDDGNGMAGHKVFAGSGDLYRNAYPLFANKTVYEGQRATDPEKRVCILTRSAFPGQQRYAAALWSGDIAGDWVTFKRQIPAGLHVCLTGMPYWTTDCGGFFRPRDQYQSDDFAELLTRWFQYSTFCPVQRMHGYQSETEFWKFPKAQDNLVQYDKFRYRLLPYIYSTAWQVTSNGYTMMRALPMDFRTDAIAREIEDEYMFGPAFLVSPVTEPGVASRIVYLPENTTWTNFWTGETVKGGELIEVAAPREVIPLHVRSGSIIPMGPDLQYAGEKATDPTELRVYAGADGSFTLYEDEGDSYRYESGVYSTIELKWDESEKTLTIGQRKGEFPGMLKERTFNIVWVSAGKGTGMLHTANPDVTVKYDGKATVVKMKQE